MRIIAFHTSIICRPPINQKNAVLLLPEPEPAPDLFTDNNKWLSTCSDLLDTAPTAHPYATNVLYMSIYPIATNGVVPSRIVIAGL
mmetsp:Transcript_122068/g.211830  ORF Transcript_122068/g.211830 Transcript_122068/m.211830 type:complete len:86 (+) Transcript_122068:763-1020(+)